MTNVPLVEAVSVTKTFTVSKSVVKQNRKVLTAVDNVSLKIGHGETVGLVGESGCGKSTFGRSILQLIKADSGEVYYEGEPTFNASKEKMREYRKRMQIIFQDPYASLNPRRTMIQSVMAPLDVYGIGTKAERREMAEEAMHRVGLTVQQMNQYPHEMSGGQRQRAVIARAMILDPSMVICDEPVSALDVSVRSQVLNLMNSLQREKNLSYLFVSHDLSVVRYICHSIAVMYLGRIVETGANAEVFAHPAHPYTEALLSAIPIPDVNVRNKRIVLEGDVPNPMNPPSGCTFHTRCPYATEQCRHERPELREIGPGHCVACHKPL